MSKIIGIDIGGTTSSVVLGETNGTVLDKISFPSKTERGVEYTLGKLITATEKLITNSSLKTEEIEAIGVSCGGPLDSLQGIILSPPNLPGWDKIPIVDIIKEKFNIATYLENDANASALAEWQFGAGQGFNNIIFLTFGTGLGAGLILNGKLYRGANDLAGEVGHIRLKSDGPVGYNKAGSFEGFCSGGGIANLAKIILKKKQELGLDVSIRGKPIDKITARDVGVAASEGNLVAKEILAISGKYLGYGLAILIDIFNPELIIIGSIYYRSQSYIEPAAFKVLKSEALDLSYEVCQIIPSGLKEKIGDYASLSVAINHI